MFKSLYASFAYLGLLTLPAAFILGFRYNADAPLANLWFNLALFAVWAGVSGLSPSPNSR